MIVTAQFIPSPLNVTGGWGYVRLGGKDLAGGIGEGGGEQEEGGRGRLWRRLSEGLQGDSGSLEEEEGEAGEGKGD